MLEILQPDLGILHFAQVEHVAQFVYLLGVQFGEHRLVDDGALLLFVLAEVVLQEDLEELFNVVSIQMSFLLTVDGVEESRDLVHPEIELGVDLPESVNDEQEFLQGHLLS